MLADVLERTRKQVAEELERRTGCHRVHRAADRGPPQAAERIRRRSDRSPAAAVAPDAPPQPIPPSGDGALELRERELLQPATSSSRSNRSSSKHRPPRRPSSAEWVGTAERTRLREQNQRLRTLLDDVEDSAALFGPDGRILYCNLPAFQGLRSALGVPARRDHRPHARQAVRRLQRDPHRASGIEELEALARGPSKRLEMP